MITAHPGNARSDVGSAMRTDVSRTMHVRATMLRIDGASSVAASCCDATEASTIRSGCGDNVRQHGTGYRSDGGCPTKNEFQRRIFAIFQIFFQFFSRGARRVRYSPCATRFPARNARQSTVHDVRRNDFCVVVVGLHVAVLNQRKPRESFVAQGFARGRRQALRSRRLTAAYVDAAWCPTNCTTRQSRHASWVCDAPAATTTSCRRVATW